VSGRDERGGVWGVDEGEERNKEQDAAKIKSNISPPQHRHTTLHTETLATTTTLLSIRIEELKATPINSSL